MNVTSPARFGPIFDADNHYWESSDAFPQKHRIMSENARELTFA